MMAPTLLAETVSDDSVLTSLATAEGKPEAKSADTTPTITAGTTNSYDDTVTSPGLHFPDTSAKPTVRFHPFLSADEWVQSQPWTAAELRKQFATEGFLKVEDLVDEKNIEIYRDVYDALVSNTIDASSHRQDLGSNEEQKVEKEENVFILNS